MSDDVHEVYAVCYGSHSRKRAENYIFGDPHDEMASIAYYVWVIKGPHGTFVCDTGFDEAAAKERGRKITHPVGDGLKALGVEPDKVDHVVATHMHWDHVSGLPDFPDAEVWVRPEELEHARHGHAPGFLQSQFGKMAILTQFDQHFARTIRDELGNGSTRGSGSITLF